MVFSEVIQFEIKKTIEKDFHLHSVEEAVAKSFNINVLTGFFQMIKTDLVEIYTRLKNNIEALIENKSTTFEREWKMFFIVFTANHTLFIFDAYDGNILYKR